MRCLLAASLAASLAPTDASAGALRRYRAAAAEGKVTKLTNGLKHNRSYIRTLSAEGLASVERTDSATERLLRCVADADERDWVRSACASTLGSWQVTEAVPVIAGVLGEVGAECRYWMAEALHRLGGSEARATLIGLTSDPDLFISTAAREWSK